MVRSKGTSQMKLLVVDDSKDITDVLMVYCESKGVECTVVNAGIDGLEVIRNNSNFDLILLDLAMPEFSGLDVIQTLKNENLLERRNIVVFTTLLLIQRSFEEPKNMPTR